MTFPVVEIYCPECKEPMTLVNKPSIEDTVFNRKGYDKVVDYHYQCKSNERHIGKWHVWSMELSKDILYKGELKGDGEPVEINKDNAQNYSKISEWCNISSEKNIVVMRILIPNLINESYSSPTTATVNMINIEKQMQDDGFIKFNKSEPATNLLLNIPDKEIYNFDQKELISLEELETKVELTRKKYPDEKDYIYAFMDAGKKIIIEKKISDTDTYEMLKEIIELANPEKLKLPRELELSLISDKMKVFMNECFDLILNKEV